MVAIYKLPLSVKLARSCLGRSYFAHIAGMRTRMTLPCVEWVGYDVRTPDGETQVWHEFRVIPPAVDSLPEATTDDCEFASTDRSWWGSVREWRLNPPRFEGAWIRAVVFEFDIPDDKLDRRPLPSDNWIPDGSTVGSMFEGVDEWFQLLLVWIGAVGDQDTLFANPHVRPSATGQGLTMRAVTDGGSSVTAYPPGPYFLYSDFSEPVSLAAFKRIVAATNRGHRPPDSHQFLRDARGDLRRERYRKAVIDAGTGVEVVLAEWRRNHPAPGKDPHPPRPTLGVYVQHTTATLPTDTKVALVDVRNDAIHNGVTPTKEQAARAVEIAIDVVRRLDPLPVLPSRRPRH